MVSKRWSHAGRISEFVFLLGFAGLVKFRFAHSVEQMNKIYSVDDVKAVGFS